MTISVIIPARNEEKYLPKTLDAIKRMHRQPDEIIIVDGGSRDTTTKIAKSYGAVVLVVLHGTIGNVRQEGLKKAKGDIVAYTDADTLVPVDWLDKIVDSLSKPGASAVFGDYKVAKESNEGLAYIYWMNWVYPVILRIAKLFGLYIGGGQNIAFWRDKGIQTGGFPVDFKSVEDFEMLKRLSKVGKVIFNPHNVVISSGRRAREGLGMVLRVTRGMLIYFLTGKADRFGFPDIR